MIISKSTKNRFFRWLFDFFKISENSGYMLEIIGYSLRTVIMNPKNGPDNHGHTKCSMKFPKLNSHLKVTPDEHSSKCRTKGNIIVTT
jgi:hypothetical protein